MHCQSQSIEDINKDLKMYFQVKVKTVMMIKIVFRNYFQIKKIYRKIIDKNNSEN
jgi:hypothetical protein